MRSSRGCVFRSRHIRYCEEAFTIRGCEQVLWRANWGETNYYNEQGGTPIGDYPLETSDLTNGVHIIEVVDDQGNRDVVKFKVYNQLYDVHFEDSFSPTPNVIRARMTLPQWWRVKISNWRGVVIREYYGYGTSINVTWDRRDFDLHIAREWPCWVSVEAVKSHVKVDGVFNAPASQRTTSPPSVTKSLK